MYKNVTFIYKKISRWPFFRTALIASLLQGKKKTLPRLCTWTFFNSLLYMYIVFVGFSILHRHIFISITDTSLKSHNDLQINVSHFKSILKIICNSSLNEMPQGLYLRLDIYSNLLVVWTDSYQWLSLGIVDSLVSARTVHVHYIHTYTKNESNYKADSDNLFILFYFFIYNYHFHVTCFKDRKSGFEIYWWSYPTHESKIRGQLIHCNLI